MATPFNRRTLLTGVGAAALLSACTMGGESTSSTSASSATSASASTSGSGNSDLPTFTAGKLTIATGEPAYSPWVLNDDPASGEGFEAAVAYAVAEQLGFAKDDVVWVRTTFDAAIAPGAKDWDFNLQQFSIVEERKNAVDFSSSYYRTAQAVVALEGSKAVGATAVADLKGVLFGVQAGTTSQQMVAATVTPDADPMIFSSSQDTVQALKGGQVDAIVVDLPTALFLTAVELDGGVIVGQFADTTGGEDFGLVLPKGSALTAPVTEAVDALRADGTLDELAKKWLSDSAEIPVLS